MEIEQHREGEYGFGVSKAQHFIQHLRDAASEPDWRDQQERWAEAAQMAVCEELKCPVCRDNCSTLTKYHWDINRVYQDKPVDEEFARKHEAISNYVNVRLRE